MHEKVVNCSILISVCLCILIGYAILISNYTETKAHAQGPGLSEVIVDTDKEIREGSTSYITLSFKDKDGNPIIPNQIKYNIRDEDTKKELLTAQTVTTGLAATYTIEVPASANVIVTQKPNEYTVELHTLTLETTYSSTRKVTTKITYPVARLRFYPFS